MRPSILTILATSLILAAAPAAQGQRATAVAKLDVDQFRSGWYEIARYPARREKTCVSDGRVLYSLGDKKNTFQMVTSCQIKNGNWDWWNKDGKLDGKGSGRLRVRWLIWPLTKAYWVVAAAPDYSWMLVGTPNHRSLWVLSKTPQLSEELFGQAKAQAAAQGFDTAKLVPIKQQGPLEAQY